MTKKQRDESPWTPGVPFRLGDVFETQATLSRGQVWWRRVTQLRWNVPTTETRLMQVLSTHTADGQVEP